MSVFKDDKIKDTKIQIRRNLLENQAEKLPNFIALENIQNIDTNDKAEQIYTDSRIALDSLKKLKSHKYLIGKLRRKLIELERQNWKLEFSWIKANAGHQGNELAHELPKEAATNKNIKVYYG